MTSSMKSRGHVTKNDSLEVPGSSPGKDLLSKQARKESGHVEKCTVYQEILHMVGLRWYCVDGPGFRSVRLVSSFI